MDWIAFALFLTACGAAATTGAMFPPGDWYDRLDKPAWTPPDWLFPVAWTLLYIAISVAPARVVGQEGADYALILWGVQIAFNTLWTPIFFGLRRLGGGMAVLIGLWLSVAATMVALFGLDPLSGWLFVPYLVWVSYAGALNLSIWRRNPEPVAA
ncbi:tryptophan-rich sensory protein TspO [Pontivivens ytuae]|uniref:Tryptophan-rich sensory protein n=1 Tax=Pontivivens ytuae TaxID=2789856 RepID=A0A7S9LSK4_9RHOB|nr:TspO/MBR family protein [Pontivivens ytuae]QPH54205.1 tryptophan-rich sensory protein [Pontivivens ytuae]